MIRTELGMDDIERDNITPKWREPWALSVPLETRLRFLRLESPRREPMLGTYILACKGE